MSPSNRLYNAALPYLGTKETPGPQSTGVIQQWIVQAADWLDKDDSKTAWCGCFRGAVGYSTGTGVPQAHYRARSWLEWGHVVPIGEVQRGDTVILDRRGGAHVGLVDRVAGASVYVLGGNQSDAVTIARFPLAAVLGVRR